MAIPFWDESDGADGDLVAQNPWDRCIVDGVALPGIAEVSSQVKHKHDKKNAAGKHGGSTTTSGQQLADVDIKLYLWTPAQFEFFTDTTIPLILPKPAEQPAAKKTTASTTKTPAENAANLQAIDAVVNDRVLALAGLTFTEAATVSGDASTSFEQREKNTAKGKAAAKKAAAAQPRALSIFHPALAMLRIVSVIVVSVSTPKPGRTVGEKMVEIKAVEFRAPKSNKAPATSTPVAEFGRATELQGSDNTASNSRQALPSQNKAYTNP